MEEVNDGRTIERASLPDEWFLELRHFLGMFK